MRASGPIISILVPSRHKEAAMTVRFASGRHVASSAPFGAPRCIPFWVLSHTAGCTFHISTTSRLRRGYIVLLARQVALGLFASRHQDHTTGQETRLINRHTEREAYFNRGGGDV
jgi:hypothetical protein